MYKRLHCLNCGHKFTRVYDRRRHEKNVSCEKKEIYNDPEILVRLSSLESSVLKLWSVCEKLCGELKRVRVRKGGVGVKKVVGVGVGVGSEKKNIKQKKMLEYL